MSRHLSSRKLFINTARHIEARNVITRRVQYPCAADPEFCVINYLLPNENVFLMYPACDFDRILLTQGNVGTIPLPDVLEHVQQLKKATFDGENATFIIPLAECRNRAHWTFLQIKGSEVKFYDPRPRLPSILSYFEYSLTPTRNYLQKFGYNLYQENINYLGLQPWTDDVYCGYFVGYAIYSLLTHKSISHITTENVFTEFLNPNPVTSNFFEEATVLETAIVVERFEQEYKEDKHESSNELQKSMVIEFAGSTPAPTPIPTPMPSPTYAPTIIPSDPIEGDWISLEYKTFDEAKAANHTLTLIDLGPQKQKFLDEPLTPYITDALNTLPEISGHPGLTYAMAAKEEMFKALINDKKYWKSKSHFSYEIPKGLQLMQNKSFEDVKKIGHLQLLKKKSLFQFFTCYNSRDPITHLLYKSLSTSTSLFDLHSNAAFNEVLKDYANWQTKHHSEKTNCASNALMNS